MYKFFFLSILITLLCSVNATGATSCSDLLSKHTNEAMNLDNAHCLENTELSFKNAKSYTQPDNEITIFANNLVNMDITVSELSDLFSGKEFHLVVHGICAGKCSRLLIPLATSTSFTEGSFAVLNESSLQSRLTHGVSLILDHSKVDKSLGIIGTNEKNYRSQYNETFVEELAILRETRVSVIHLLWHEFMLNTALANKSACNVKDPIIVLLTSKYFKQNFIYVPKSVHTIYEKIDLDSVDSKMKKVFGDNAVLYTPFNNQPTFDCDVSD